MGANGMRSSAHIAGNKRRDERVVDVSVGWKIKVVIRPDTRAGPGIM